MALLLDLANIVGGFLLAIPLLRRLPVIGYDLGRFAARVAPRGWIVGIAALVAGGYYLIVHAISGPRLFHFEVIGIGVGVALTWDRLTGRRPPAEDKPADSHPQRKTHASSLHEPSGRALLIAIFGLIAILVGIQGLFTPDG